MSYRPSPTEPFITQKEPTIRRRKVVKITSTDYSRYNIAELRDVARKQRLNGYSRANRAELIAMLDSHDTRLD